MLGGVLLVAVSGSALAQAPQPPAGAPLPVPPVENPSVPPPGVIAAAPADESPAGKARRGKRLTAAERVEWRRARLASRREFRGLGRGGALAAFREKHPRLLQEKAFAPLAGLDVDQIRSEHAAVVETRSEGKKRPSLVVSSSALATSDGAGGLVPVDMSLRPSADGFVPERASEAVTIPDVATEPSTIGDDRGVSVAPLGTAASDGVLENDTVVYPNVMLDTDYAVQPVADGVRTFHHLRSVESPETLTLRVSLPAGAALVGDPERGMQIMRGDEELGTVSTAVAWDADMQPVPVTTTVRGDTLEMTVEHRAMEVAYPLVVDPVIQRSSHNTQIWAQNHVYHGWSGAASGPGFDLWAHSGYVPSSMGVTNGPQYFPAGAYAQWMYYAGGATARIWWARFYGWGVPYHYSAGSTTYTGLFSTQNANWETNQYGTTQVWSQAGNFDQFNPAYCPLPASQPTWSNPEPGCIDWGGSYNNVAVLALQMQTSGERGWGVSLIRGFGVAIADWHQPSVSAQTTTSWTADGQVVVRAADTGLGIGSVRVEAPNQPEWAGAFYDELVTRTDPAPAGKCDASSYKPCPRETTSPLALRNLPKGRNHTLRVWITDAVGNVLPPHDYVVGVAAPATDRALYREADRAEVWAMSGGRKHWVSSSGAAASAGLDLGAVVVVPSGNLASYARGRDIDGGSVSSWRFGGSNAAVDLDTEVVAAQDAYLAAATDADAQALLDGLLPEDRTRVLATMPQFALDDLGVSGPVAVPATVFGLGEAPMDPIAVTAATSPEVNCGSGATCGTYDGRAAGAYAHQYWRNYNDRYPRFSNDCTNFVSQALKAGGLKFMRTGGYNSPTPTASEFVDHFRRGTGSWWSARLSNSAGGYMYRYTASWVRATESYERFLEYGAAVTVDRAALRHGDILYYQFPDGGGRWTHAAIISRITRSGPIVAQHTTDLEEPLADVIKRLSEKWESKPNQGVWRITAIRPTRTAYNIP